MIHKYRNQADFLIRRLLAALKGKKADRVSIIGGADGPTAVFTVRKPRRQRGKLQFDPDFAETLRALQLAAVFLLAVVSLAELLYRALGRDD